MCWNRWRILKLATLALLFVVLGLLAGCWDKKEAEDLGYVRATVIDSVSKDSVRVLVQVPNPRALGGGGLLGLTPGASTSAKSYRNFEARGTTVFDAIRQLSLQSPHQLFWAQNLLVIFTERTARRDIDRHLDFLERSVEIRRRLNYVLVTPSDPRVLLDIPAPHDLVPALRIGMIIDENWLSSRFAAVTFSEFLQMLATEGQDAYCGVVRARRNPAWDPLMLEPAAPEPPFIIELSGAAAFRGARLAGYLTERETRGVLWARGRMRGGAVAVQGPAGGGPVSLEILRAKGRIVPEIREGRLLATVEVTGVEADIADSEGLLDLTRPDRIQSLERVLARAIEGEVLAAANKAQSLGTDVLGVGAAFHRKFPREWREMKGNWPEIFATVEISARAEVTIRRTGLIQKGVPIVD